MRICPCNGSWPGGLSEYMDMFYSDDKMMGGCIWEWADHAAIHTEEGAKYRYTYGGDHGEYMHDGNFCVDGLFYPDRTPHTGAYENESSLQTRKGRKNCRRISLYKYKPFPFFRLHQYRLGTSQKTELKPKSGQMKLDIAPCASQVIKVTSQ